MPEVALVRLHALLNNNLPEVEWRAVVEEVVKAQIAAETGWRNTLILLDDIRYVTCPGQNFGVPRPLLPCIGGPKRCHFTVQLASDERSPFRSAATFGAAEMLRALGRRDEALKKFTLLTHDKEWATRTKLRAAEFKH